MGTFIATPEEKAAHSYLDFDDAALGAFTKSIACMFSEMSADADGLHKVTSAACAMMLVAMAIDSNATKLESKLEGFSKCGIDHGDWIVKIRRIDDLPEINGGNNGLG